MQALRCRHAGRRCTRCAHRAGSDAAAAIAARASAAPTPGSVAATAARAASRRNTLRNVTPAAFAHDKNRCSSLHGDEGELGGLLGPTARCGRSRPRSSGSALADRAPRPRSRARGPRRASRRASTRERQEGDEPLVGAQEAERPRRGRRSPRGRPGRPRRAPDRRCAGRPTAASASGSRCVCTASTSGTASAIARSTAVGDRVRLLQRQLAGELQVERDLGAVADRRGR